MKLKELIDERGITYSSIARHLGVSNSYISQMLNGRRNIPPQTLFKILEFTRIEFEEVQDEFIDKIGG